MDLEVKRLIRFPWFVLYVQDVLVEEGRWTASNTVLFVAVFVIPAFAKGGNIPSILSSLALCFAGRAVLIFLKADGSSRTTNWELPGKEISFLIVPLGPA